MLREIVTSTSVAQICNKISAGDFLKIIISLHFISISFFFFLKQEFNNENNAVVLFYFIISLSFVISLFYFFFLFFFNEI